MTPTHKRCLPGGLACQARRLLLLTALACQDGWVAASEPDTENGYDLYTQLSSLSYSNGETLAHTYDDARASTTHTTRTSCSIVHAHSTAWATVLDSTLACLCS